MKRIVGLTLAFVGLLPLVGCGWLTNLLSPTHVTVRLVNNTNFPLTVELRLGSDQNVLEALLASAGQEVNVTLGAGQTTTFTRPCDDLQAIMVNRADLDMGLGLGPSQKSGVYRDGNHFNCGDTLVFTFTQPNVLTLSIGFAKQ